MDDSEIRFHSGIPVGHKFFAFVLAAAVAGAGCAWLIYKSTRSASVAVLSFNPTVAQQLDSGIASAQHPAVALADFMLNDAIVASLAKQVHLASTTPAGQIGEFRSDLQLSSGFQLTQPSAQQLDVRFQAADASQSIAIANDVAQALVAWNPASAASVPPPAPAPAPTATAPATPAPSQPAPQASADHDSAAPDPVAQGQSDPAAAPDPAAPSAPPERAMPPLSAALRKLAAQLSATNRQLDQLAAASSYDSHSESRQQSLLRDQIHQAQRTLAGFHRSYAQELSDPSIRARLSEIQSALESVLPGGFAAGVSRSVLRNERSELRQAVWIMGRETDGVQIVEAARPSLMAAPPAAARASVPAAPATPSPAATNPAPSTPALSAAAPPSPAPAAAQPSPSPIAEQNIPAGSAPPALPQSAQNQSAQNPWSIVHLAAAAPRPPLWPAIAAGVLCGLLYLGIAAIAYRRGAGDEIYPDLRSAPRMITPQDSVAIREESSEPPPEPSPVEAAPRHRAAFVFQTAPQPPAEPVAEAPAAPPEKRLPLW